MIENDFYDELKDAINKDIREIIKENFGYLDVEELLFIKQCLDEIILEKESE